MLLATANALTALAVFAVVINLVPMLVGQGLSRNLAAVALGLGGVGQIAGRLGYARFAAATTVTVRSVVVLAAVAVATAALALAPLSDTDDTDEAKSVIGSVIRKTGSTWIVEDLGGTRHRIEVSDLVPITREGNVSAADVTKGATVTVTGDATDSDTLTATEISVR